jgi:hypothetical protein
MIPKATAANLIFFPATMLLDIGVTFAFLMLNNKRMAMELEEAEKNA